MIFPEDQQLFTISELARACGISRATLIRIEECGILTPCRVNPETGTIEDAKFKTFGCGSAIASSSLATEWLKGKSLDEALGIKNTQIVEELALPPVKVHCSVLAEDAIKAAIKNYQEKRETTEAGEPALAAAGV